MAWLNHHDLTSVFLNNPRSFASVSEVACHCIWLDLNEHKSGHCWAYESHLRFPLNTKYTQTDCSQTNRHSELLAISLCSFSSQWRFLCWRAIQLSSASSSFPGRPGPISSAAFTWLNEPERKLECSRGPCGTAKPSPHCLSIVYTSVPAVSILAESVGMNSVISLGSVWAVKPKIRTQAARVLSTFCVCWVQAWKITSTEKWYHHLPQNLWTIANKRHITVVFKSSLQFQERRIRPS